MHRVWRKVWERKDIGPLWLDFTVWCIIYRYADMSHQWTVVCVQGTYSLLVQRRALWYDGSSDEPSRGFLTVKIWLQVIIMTYLNVFYCLLGKVRWEVSTLPPQEFRGMSRVLGTSAGAVKRPR